MQESIIQILAYLKATRVIEVATFLGLSDRGNSKFKLWLTAVAFRECRLASFQKPLYSI